MTGSEFAAYIRYKTRTNSSTLTDSEIVMLANVWVGELAKQVMGADEDTLVLPQTTDLRTNIREYPFPENILARIKRVEAKLDGTNWITLEEFDLNQWDHPTDETTIVAYFANEAKRAKYELMRKSIRIFSGAITAVTAGLKLWCNTYPAKLQVSQLSDTVTDLSEDPSVTQHGFPRELHKLWATGIIIDYKSSREKPIALTEQELRYDVDLAEAIISLKHGNLDREIFATIPPASDRGMNGQNY